MTAGAPTLVIETSNPGAGAAGEVGLARDGALVAVRVLDPRGRHDDALMPAVDALARDARVAPDEIAQIAVSVGPGGFSSVRIAVATAKMIAFATGARCLGVPSCRVAATGHAGVSCVALASKRGSAWLRVYEDAEPKTAGGAGDVSRLEELHARFGFETLIADAHAPDTMIAWARDAGVNVVAPVFSAAACYTASGGVSPVPPEALAVVYPREPEAVRAWRAGRV